MILPEDALWHFRNITDFSRFTQKAVNDTYLHWGEHPVFPVPSGSAKFGTEWHVVLYPFEQDPSTALHAEMWVIPDRQFCKTARMWIFVCNICIHFT
nr:MAG TPA: hypothetical protein [Caudoviricetes sp.]